MDDLISKNKLILYLNDWRFGVAPDETTPIKDQDKRLVMASTIYDCMLTVENFPTVAIPSKVGHWKMISPAAIYECSECGQHVMTQDICAYHYCHGCGAKMD